MDNLGKVLFDLSATQSSNESPVHGGGEYAKYVFKAAMKYKARLICFYLNDRELDDEIYTLCSEEGIELLPVSDKKEITKVMARVDIVAFYSALPYDFSGIDLHSKRFIGTVHGLRGVEFPTDKFEYIYRIGNLNKLKSFVNRYIKSKSKRRELAKQSFSKLFEKDNFEIITDSMHSKYSFISFFPHLKVNQISVYRCPYEFDTYFNKQSKPRGYFLLVSSNRWIKNNFRAILALDELFSEQNIEKKVIVLGTNGVDFLKYIKNRDKFIFKDYVSELELNSHFSEAFAFIYPTLNEGYGYPPIKAMEYQTPVIASAITSVTEVCEDAALYFNPLSISELKTRILTLLNQPDIKERLVSNGDKVVAKLRCSNESQLSDIVEHIFKSEI
ncbi:glycosyltransferase [Vibrio sp. 10N.222.52.B7]|uniref:glycosyltransferase n=1 Tax=Vibrio sp. 10N.222.52.B7 TaxID=3229629 RepID=UPI0035500897